MNLVSLVLVAAVMVGCSGLSSTSPGEQPSKSLGEHSSKPASTVPIADNLLMVPGQRVGEFVIGRDNAKSIWNYKTRKAHDSYAAYAAGLDTHFDPELQFKVGPGGELDGVLVQSVDYETAEGFRVGTSVTDIEAALGEPRLRATEQQDGVDVRVLDYGGIAFCIDNEKVTGIWVRTWKPA